MYQVIKLDNYLGGRLMINVIATIAWRVGGIILVTCGSTLIVQSTIEGMRKSARDEELRKMAHEITKSEVLRKEEIAKAEHEKRFEE